MQYGSYARPLSEYDSGNVPSVALERQVSFEEER